MPHVAAGVRMSGLDRYDVIRRLAIGGMGEIFLARQKGVGGFSRLAILKTLRPELAEDPAAVDQFLEEAKVAAQLSHANIVGIYEVGAVPRRGDDGEGRAQQVYFIAMEFIGGVDVSSLLKAARLRERAVPARVAGGIALQAAIGLDFAHHASSDKGAALEVVHRDISPQNLMVRADGLVKIVDFGVASASTRSPDSGDKLKGKIRYMSPEQLLGEALDGRSDQFSLGVVLWELLTGKPLFSGTNPIEIFQKILAGGVQAPSVAGAPDGVLDDVVMRMLQARAADRFARCADAAAALRTALGGADTTDDVRTFLQDVAGTSIADRLRDLESAADDADARAHALRAFLDGVPAAPTDGAAITAVTTHVVRKSSESSLSRAAPDAPSNSDVVLAAAEGSGALGGDRRLLVVVVGVLPGWSGVTKSIANVPLGAFGVQRMKRLFLRELDNVVQRRGGSLVQRGADSFVIAFGLDEPRASDADEAVDTALAVRALLADPSRGLSVHIGVTGGLAVVRSDGTTSIGGVVVENAEVLAKAARRAGRGILVDEAVADLLKDRAVFGPPLGDDAPAGARDVLATRDSVTVQKKKKRILIADDAEVFRKIEEEMLRPYAYSFLHARDGAQALKLAVEEKPDLILLDIQMPVMDGVQVLQFLKKNKDTASIPVVIVTTIGRAHDEELLRRGGADEFLTKPVRPAVLASVVKKLLR